MFDSKSIVVQYFYIKNEETSYKLLKQSNKQKNNERI